MTGQEGCFLGGNRVIGKKRRSLAAGGRARRRGGSEPKAKAMCNLVDQFEPEFLDHGIGQDVLGDALDLGFGFVFGKSVELEDEEFPLADVLHLGVAEGGESALDGLALGIEDGGLQHDPNVSFHWPPF